MDLKRKRNILWVSIWFLTAMAILGALMKTSWLMVAVIAAVVIWSVLMLCWWRCPRCGKSLGHLDQKTYCPYCGEELYSKK